MPRLLCFIPAPKQNRTPHRNTTPNLQRPPLTDARRHDVPTNPTPRQHKHASLSMLKSPHKKKWRPQQLSQPWRYTRTSGTHCRVATETHDRRCRSSVVGYQVNVYLRHTLPSFFTSRWLVVARQCDGAAMQLPQYTFLPCTIPTTYIRSHGVIRVPPARIVWGCHETHDHRCRSSVVGYLHTLRACRRYACHGIEMAKAALWRCLYEELL